MKNPEHYEHQGGEVRQSIIGRLALVGALAITVPFNVSMSIDADKTVVMNPAEQLISDNHDGEFRVATFNTAGKLNTLSNLAKVYESEKLDVVCLQEVYEKDLKYARSQFASSQIIFFNADGVVGVRRGGFGNAIISRQKISDYYNYRIDGWTNFSKILPQDIKDFRKEQRSVAFADYRIDAGADKPTNIRIINTHTAGNSRQHRDVRDFIKHNKDNSKITIFCGDLNAVPPIVKNDVLPVKDGWNIKALGQTSGGHQIDYLATNFGDISKTLIHYDYKFVASARPDLNLGSDHYIAIGKLTAKLASKETLMTNGAELGTTQ